MASDAQELLIALNQLNLFEGILNEDQQPQFELKNSRNGDECIVLTLGLEHRKVRHALNSALSTAVITFSSNSSGNITSFTIYNLDKITKDKKNKLYAVKTTFGAVYSTNVPPQTRAQKFFTFPRIEKSPKTSEEAPARCLIM